MRVKNSDQNKGAGRSINADTAEFIKIVVLYKKLKLRDD